MAEGKDERATENPNTIYNLSSVLFHALKGGALYDQYIEDAEQEGDHELVDFFRRVRDEDSIRADEARLLLVKRTPATKRTEDDVTPATEGGAAASASARIGQSGVPSEELGETSPRPEPSADLPSMEPVAEGAPSGDVRRETTITRMLEEDLSAPHEAPPPRTEPASTPPEPGDVPPRGPEEALPPSRMIEVEEVALPGTEEAPPSRTEEVPIAEEVSSGIPSQAPPGDVASPAPGEAPHEDMAPPPRETSPEPSATTEENSRAEEDKGLVERVRDYLLGEGRESDYPRSENRER